MSILMKHVSNVRYMIFCAAPVFTGLIKSHRNGHNHIINDEVPILKYVNPKF